MRRILLAAMMCGVTAGAQAADLSDLPILRGAFTEGLSNSKVNWQGYYVGGQADYGSITSKMPSGINSDLQSTFFPPPGVTYNWLGLGQARSTNSGYGAFAGYNSQWDDVVLGLEANYLHGGFRANSASTGYTYLNDNVTIASTTHSSALVTLSDFGSLRVRAGYVMGCFLPYVYLGGGFGSRTVDRNVSEVKPKNCVFTLHRKMLRTPTQQHCANCHSVFEVQYGKAIRCNSGSGQCTWVQVPDGIDVIDQTH